MRARKLLLPKHRRASGLFLAQGPHVIAEALTAGLRPREAFVAGSLLRATTAPLVQRLRDAGADVHEVSTEVLRELADTQSPQGLVAVLPEPRTLARPFAEEGLWLLLDGVQDPGNAGTLVRAAEALGARGVLGLSGSVDLWGGKVLRAGQGAHFHLSVLQDGSESRTGAEWLAAWTESGGEIWAAARGGGAIYTAPRPPDRLMLALGNEAQGVSEAVAGASARTVGVPQRGRTESLNVAMAGSILLSWLAHAAARQDPA